MKKSSLLLTVLLLVIGNLLPAQSLDDILKEHFAAIGQDSLLKVNTQKLTGKMVQGGIEIPFIQMAKRPGKVRVEGTFQDLTFVQTFNGTEGWNLNPFTGVTDPQPMSEDDIKGMRYQADMDGMLWNWKDKGSTLTLEGKEDMEGTSCYKIKLETKEGDTFTYFIDSDSYIMLRTNTKMKVMGNEMETDTYYTNYMMIQGIAIPATIETKIKDQLVATLVIDKVELNTDLDDALFEKPSK
ncbi:MAG: outer membrane lipoprotein-sorting protein [Bacteroidales bacterium]